MAMFDAPGRVVARASASCLCALLVPAGQAWAQSIPTVDTEDASLGSQAVGRGRLHPVIGLDVRNGDFARGGYDDDAANLDRVPVHVQLGFAYDLHRDRDGKADWWIVGTSSNGFHAPSADERTSPRAWYESNNLLAIVAAPATGLTVGAVYTIKTSPNGVAGTSHEASVTAALDGDGGLAALHPGAAITWRPQGGGGVFTQVSVEPEVALGGGDDAPSLSFPAILGVGWAGFYQAGTGDVAYGSGGVAYSRPFTLGSARWRLRAEALAVVRDPTLRRLGSLDAETSRVVPLVTIGLTLAY